MQKGKIMNIILLNSELLTNNTKKSLRSSNKDLTIKENLTYNECLSFLKKSTNETFVIIDCDDKHIFWHQSVNIFSENSPNTKLILFTSNINADELKFAYKNNICGIIQKSSSEKQLKSALDFIIAGGTIYPNPLEVAEKNRKTKTLNENTLTFQVCPLTNRQEEVLGNLSLGLSNKQIAHEMKLAEATVKLHVNALLRSLGVTNRTHAVITAQKLGLI